MTPLLYSIRPPPFLKPAIQKSFGEIIYLYPKFNRVQIFNSNKDSFAFWDLINIWSCFHFSNLSLNEVITSGYQTTKSENVSKT